VARAIVQHKTRVIDIDLSSYFDNVRHDRLLAKVAERVDDGDVMHLLKVMLKANGGRYCAVSPPSTTNSAPVVKDDSSLARKRTVLATSSALPIRPIGAARARPSRTRSGFFELAMCYGKVEMSPLSKVEMSPFAEAGGARFERGRFGDERDGAGAV